MNAQLRAAAAQYDNASPPESRDLDDSEIVELIADSGLDAAMLDAAVFAVRNNDFGYLVKQYRNQVGPLIDAELGA